MGFHFYETGYGKRFFDQQLPLLTKSLNRIADALESDSNGSKEEKERHIYVSYHYNLTPSNPKYGIISDLSTRICTVDNVKKWASKMIQKLYERCFILTDFEKLWEFYSNLTLANENILEMKHITTLGSNVEFVLKVERFQMNAEDKQ